MEKRIILILLLFTLVIDGLNKALNKIHYIQAIKDLIAGKNGDKTKYVNTNLLVDFLKGNLYYTFYDIDENGVSELVVSLEKLNIIDIFQLLI